MSVEITVRLLRPEDLDAVVAIDAAVTGKERPSYFRRKIAAAADQTSRIDASLVAEAEGEVVGFLMGTLFIGEFGIPDSSTVVDTLGVLPSVQDHGVGAALFEQFIANMRAARVGKIYTVVDWKDYELLKFFGHMGFVPSQRLSLECPLD